MKRSTKFGCYFWTTWFQYKGTSYQMLQSAPMYEDGKIDPKEACDVSFSAFDEKELEEFITEVARLFEEPRQVVRGWIRG